MQAIQIISQDLFDKIRSRFSNLEMGNETGAVTIDPVDARFFDFDFVLEGNNLGRVSISLNDLGSLKVYYSQGITENQDDPTKQLWYKFLKEMRFFAMRRLLRFDTRDISKTNLDKNDFQHLATTQPPKEEPDMNTMNETKQGLQEGRNEIAKGTPDDIKLQIKKLGLGPYRRESTGSGGEAIFVFKNPNYYIYQGQDGAWVLVHQTSEGVAGNEQTMNENKKTKNNKQAGAINENDPLNKFRQRVQSQGFTDSPEERNADRLERKRRDNEKLDKMHADFMGREPSHHNFAARDADQNRWDREADHASQQRMNRDEYNTQRRKDDDEDTRQTMDMMRDRLNRMQYRNQRDVDPEQLAAISNVKYEPRKKTEGSGQAKTDDKLLAYYAKLKAEKEKQKQQGVTSDEQTMNETKQGLAVGRKEIATGTPDDIKLQIKKLGLGPARRESTGSGGEAIFVFRNPNYYVSQGQDGNWVLVQTNAELDQQGVAGGLQESRWNHKSSRKTSRAIQGKTEVIVRHANPVDEEYAGSRSQKKNIKAIFIQNHDGERFKYPFIHPAGAFAMAQHVDHGGIPHDPAGKAIIRMSEEIAQLGEFQRKVHSATLHDDATGITERAIGRMNKLKSQVAALSKRHHYESWMAEFSEMESGNDIMELDDVTMEEYKQKFTQTNFQEELASYFPLLHKIMRETDTVDLEDYVSEQAVVEEPDTLGIGQQMARDGIKYSPDKENELIDLMVQYMKKNGMSSKEIRYRLNYDEDYIPDQLSDLPKDNEDTEEPPFEPDTKSNFSKPNNPNRTGMDAARALAQRGMSPAESINTFEEWAEAVEQGKLTDDQIQELKTAIEQLPMGAEGPELELGSDGQTAIQFFQGLGLDDSELEEKLKDMANVDPKTDALQVLKLWADEHYPELSVALGISGAGEEPAAPAPEAPPTPEQPVAEGNNKKSEMIKTIAERVKSFYNRDNPDVGPFRGEQNIATEIKKECSEKYGDRAGIQAYQMAEMFMEKLTNEWNHKHGKVNRDDGLSIDRLKELVGNIKAKVEGMAEGDGKPNSWMEPDMRKDFENAEISSFLLYNIRMIYRWAKEGRNIRDYIQDLKKLEHENISKPTTAAAFKFIMDNLASGTVTDPKMIMQIADKAHTLMGYNDIEQATREGVDKSQIPAKQRKDSGNPDWKMSTQDLEKERDQSRTTQQGLDAHAAKTGVGQKHQHESAELASIRKLAGLGEGSGPKEKRPFVDRASPESQAKIQAARDKITKDEQSKPGKELADKINKKK